MLRKCFLCGKRHLKTKEINVDTSFFGGRIVRVGINCYDETELEEHNRIKGLTEVFTKRFIKIFDKKTGIWFTEEDVKQLLQEHHCRYCRGG